MIKIKNLNKNYDDFQVIQDMNINIYEGDIYGLIGKSGSGKSTLLRCINGLENFNSGSISIDGSEINHNKKDELRSIRKSIGFVFQDFALFERSSVYDNVAYPMRCWAYDKSSIKSNVEDILKLVGIEDKINSKASKLSGGQKQRVGIARALSLNPKILLCDEPTSALDPNTADSIINLLAKINREKKITIIFVAHQIELVQKLCNRMSIIENGKLLESGSVKEIFLNKSDSLLSLTGIKEVMIKDHLKISILLQHETMIPIETILARELEIDFYVINREKKSFTDGQVTVIEILVNKNHIENISRYLDKNKIEWNIKDGYEYARVYG